MTDKSLCTCEFCPWDHDPAMCAICVERGVLMAGSEPDPLADRLAQSDNLLDEQPLTSYQLEEIEMSAKALRMEQYLVERQKELDTMTPEERDKREARLLKALGF